MPAPARKRNFQLRKILLRVERTANRDRRCCCAFWRLFCEELATNNLVFNLVATTSPLNRRSFRLQLFFLTLLLEFSLCALFYNLYPSEDDDAPLFWEGIAENFWVALFTALFAIVPLFLLALLYRTPARWISRLKKAEDLDHLP